MICVFKLCVVKQEDSYWGNSFFFPSLWQPGVVQAECETLFFLIINTLQFGV